MPKVWLFLDVNNLAHRAFHSTGGLAHNGDAVGVLFGVFRDILFLTERYQTPHLAFCFDSEKSLRREFYPPYREHRRTKSGLLNKVQLQEQANFGRQLKDLPDHLRDMGFRNVFSAEGYEADDVLASLCPTKAEGDEALLVSTDHDLYQLLGPGVLIHNPVKHRLFSEVMFRAEWEVPPQEWPVVKALAGCPGDGVAGIARVGERTAVKYLRGELKPSARTYQAITSQEGQDVKERNLKLVKLPYEGCPRFDLDEDEVSPQKWDRVVERMGMVSLQGRCPVLAGARK